MTGLTPADVPGPISTVLFAGLSPDVLVERLDNVPGDEGKRGPCPWCAQERRSEAYRVWQGPHADVRTYWFCTGNGDGSCAWWKRL